MNCLPHDPTDAAALAASIRDLAHQAHRRLRDPAAGPEQFRELVQRITRLQELHRLVPSTELDLWLETLKQRLEATRVSSLPSCHEDILGGGNSPALLSPCMGRQAW